MTNLSELAESAWPAPGVTGPTRKPDGRKPWGSMRSGAQPYALRRTRG